MRQGLANMARQWLRRTQGDAIRRRPQTVVHLALENLESRELLSWTPYAQWDPGPQVKALSIGAAPGTGAFIPYAIGLNDNVYSVAAGATPQLTTPGQVISFSAVRSLVDGGDGNLYAEIFVVRADDHNIYYTRAAAGGVWSAVYMPWAPGIAVNSVSVGYDPVNGGFAVYAVGLDSQVYRVDQNVSQAQLLTGGGVKAIAAAQEPQIGNRAWVFAIGLNDYPYLTEGDSSGNWEAFFNWNASLTVRSLSVGVEPGNPTNEIALYGVGLNDMQVYTIPSLTPVGNPITSGAVLGLAADQLAETDGSAYVFVVGLNEQIYYTMAFFPSSPSGAPKHPVTEMNGDLKGTATGLADQVFEVSLDNGADGRSWTNNRKLSFGQTRLGHSSVEQGLDALASPVSAVGILGDYSYDPI